ncbi:MAG: dienelactone hydrolase family protein [Pirellulaceae bacterium]|nr:dienelactone hydrolase family protein [Planctomycetales bacterium]
MRWNSCRLPLIVHSIILTGLSASLLTLVHDDAFAEIQTKEIAYKHGELECRGFLAWDDSVQGLRPGVLVLHEWWGLNDYARQRTEQLAGLGYVAFAADIYGGGKTFDHPQDAGKMAGEVRANVQDWRRRAEAALRVLTSQSQCDKQPVAAVGYCFGGATALQLAYTGADLKAVATFHAALPPATEAEAKSIKAELLVCHGADDTFVGQDAVKAFKDGIAKGPSQLTFIAYPGAKHSFTVPTADSVGIPGIAYNKAADEQSWAEMKSLFQRRLRTSSP